jgi:hypothetical protein
MFWLYASVIGVVVGMTTGWIAEQVRTAPLVQSLAAFFTAVVLGTILAIVVWFLRPTATGGMGAVSVGIGIDNFFYVSGLVATAAVLHVGLGYLGGAAPLAARHRALILGIVGGLSGALTVAWAMSVSSS